MKEEDSISDDLLNQHYDELEKQQYGGEISDNQLNELYDQLDQQQLDALNIDLGLYYSDRWGSNLGLSMEGAEKPPIITPHRTTFGHCEIMRRS